MKNHLVLGLLLLAVAVPPSTARAEVLVSTIVEALVDGGNNYNWEKVALPGTVCGNGSQYKFFVHRSTTGSKNLLFFLEGGGACWDYDTCSGRAGLLGAANPNGIVDDYMQQFTAKYVSPLVNGADPGLPLRSRTDIATKDWNIVYLPYCTGDVHVGNNVAVYTDSTGAQPPLTWHHSGYTNTMAAIAHAKAQFPSVQKLLVTGYSAGGTATSAGYYFIRRGINPARGYFLNDSGPIYLAPNVNDRSRPLHAKIRQSWNLDSVLGLLPASFDRNNMGTINRMLSMEFPSDQLAYSGYSRDYNYSRFSYERFYSPNDKETVLSYWKEDQDKLVAELNLYNNYSYFIPHERAINASHCSTIITFIGAHACQQMEKKHNWWEYLEWPWGQTYKCYSEFVPMETFLHRFINENQRIRIYEPVNGYNAEDPGMGIVAPLINGALGG
ncbi:pectin acetylesterase-family hydrolase [Archangium lansingense]|uniref:Pectin acetylesterase-family hydrolase n=1 Tax=Archangium lansingense TaxID=2995310 RepID=A0ABT4AC73_9BACT|nr:pectin acetylesterase-family hydrolase [Archangium lansinium]MCY1079275.1 pectin acetylesterase-family hydrolase [Archangium lansinium]